MARGLAILVLVGAAWFGGSWLRSGVETVGAWFGVEPRAERPGGSFDERSPRLGTLGELFPEEPRAGARARPLSIDPGASGDPVPADQRSFRIDELWSVWAFLRDGGADLADLAAEVDALSEQLSDLETRTAALDDEGQILASPAGVRFFERTVRLIAGAEGASQASVREAVERCWEVLDRGIADYVGTRERLAMLAGSLRTASGPLDIGGGRVHRHRVARGESLSEVVSRLNVAFAEDWRIADLARWNGLEDPDELRPGTILEFPFESGEIRLSMRSGLVVVKTAAGRWSGGVVAPPRGLWGAVRDREGRVGARGRVLGWQKDGRLRIEVGGTEWVCGVPSGELRWARRALPVDASLFLRL